MPCAGTSLSLVRQNQNQILRQFVKNVSTSTSFSPQTYKKIHHSRSLHRCQPNRYSHCSRINPCEKQKEKERLKKIEDAKKSKSLWETFFPKPRKKPPIETCRKQQAKKQWQEEKIPEFISEMCKDLPEGSAIYRTKGHAFIVEVPCKKVCEPPEKSRAEILLSKIERDKQSQNFEDENNPMPNFTTVGQRLVDLQLRKLHPLYKKYEMPQGVHSLPFKCETKYRCISSSKDQSPEPNKWDQYYNRKKTNFSDFKMAVLPQYLELREREYQKNYNSIMEYKKEKTPTCKSGTGEFRCCPFTDCPDLDCNRWNNQKPRY